MESNAIESGNDVEYMVQEAIFPFRNALRMTMLTRGPGPEERFQGAEKKVASCSPFPPTLDRGLIQERTTSPSTLALASPVSSPEIGGAR